MCCASVNKPVMLYVFIKNERAISLYERLGFEVSKTINDSRYIMRNENKKYYAAYEERDRTAHQKDVSWASEYNGPIVLEVIRKYNIQPEHGLLEVGCGEDWDSRAVLESGYNDKRNVNNRNPW